MFSKLLATGALCLVASAALGGGTFGSSAYVTEEASKLSGTLKSIPDQSIEEALSGSALEGLKTRNLTIPTQQITTYETLWDKKSADEKDSEKALAEKLGREVSTICVTSSTACEIARTFKGSSCFCNAGSRIELGLAR